MQNENRRNVFFDNGKRWKKVKTVTFIVFLFIVLPIWVILIALLYSPFSRMPLSEQAILNTAIERIYKNKSAVIGRGTFLEVNNSYKKPYIHRFGEDKKLVVLTFDDGPDPLYTPQILWILKKEQVPATFFQIGSLMYKYSDIGKEILAEGSDIGLHTFSHPKDSGSTKLNRFEFIKELDFSEKIFAYNYGYKTLLFRVPYLASENVFSYYSLQYVKEAQKRGLTISDPNVDSEDWSNKNPELTTYLATAVDSQSVVVLLHDGGGNRSATVKALPNIIKYYKDRNYQFLTTSQYASQQGLPYKATLSMQDRVFIPIALSLFTLYKQSPFILSEGFLLGFIIVSMHSGLFVFLSLRQHRKIQKRRKSSYRGLVSVVVPIYNEEHAILGTVKSVLASSYKNIEVLLINDGSSDNTVKKITPLLSSKKVRLFTKQNEGKFSALNYGFEKARGTYVICIDADTRVTSLAIAKIISCFYARHVGAIAGTVFVGNKKNLLCRLQSLEYVVNQGIEKKAYDLFNSVTIVPGAFGAWRAHAVRKLGGFSSQTSAEDFDLTIAMLKSGYRVHHCADAIAYTEAPTSVKQLLKQRLRWNFGNLQVYYKYKGLLFKTSNKSLGFFILPRALFFQIPFMIFAPFVDLFIILNLLFGFRELTLLFLFIYIVLQIILEVIALGIMKRAVNEAIYTPMLRFPYLQLMYCVFYFSFFQAIKGGILAWAKIHHTGNLTVVVD